MYAPPHSRPSVSLGQPCIVTHVKGRYELTLELDFVLNDKNFALVVNLFRKLGGYGMMCCRILHNEAFVALDALKDMGLLNCPLAYICPFLVGFRVFLLSV